MVVIGWLRRRKDPNNLNESPSDVNVIWRPAAMKRESLLEENMRNVIDRVGDQEGGKFKRIRDKLEEYIGTHRQNEADSMTKCRR